jgi:hypothetical protein
MSTTNASIEHLQSELKNAKDIQIQLEAEKRRLFKENSGTSFIDFLTNNKNNILFLLTSQTNSKN